MYKVLFDYIQNDCDKNPKEIVELTVKFLDDIRNDPDKFCNNLEEIMTKVAEAHNVCPMCGEDLNTTSYADDREYLGSLCEEKFYDKECPEHGYIEFN